jgi:hypothetical protein
VEEPAKVTDRMYLMGDMYDVINAMYLTVYLTEERRLSVRAWEEKQQSWHVYRK